MDKHLNIVIFGLSITSSWGNGHATTFRSLIKALARRGHSVTFFEKDVPWYADNRDMPKPPFCETVLYESVSDLKPHESILTQADFIIVGSYVADAQEICNKVRRQSGASLAFYDIDTPVTLAKLQRQDYEYLHPDMIPEFDVYLSFTGGPTLAYLENEWSAQRARPLYCSVDPDLYYPEPDAQRDITMGYLGTYSDDRQPTVEQFLLDPARRRTEDAFCVAGAQYPAQVDWPQNVQHIEHIPPKDHRHFYCSQKFTLNVTRQDMIKAGFAPSVRLFEASACGTPIISDYWEGLDSLFELGSEILVARSTQDVEDFLQLSEAERRAIGEAAHNKVMSAHTASHRAMEIENYWHEIEASRHSPKAAAP